MTHHRLLLLDFDGTITQHDTLASLVALSIDASSSPPDIAPTTAIPSPGSPTPSSSSSTDPTPTPTTANSNSSSARKASLTTLWSEIVRDYVASHAAHVAAYHPTAEARTTLAAELAFLESVRAVEEGSVERVGGAGFFRGLGADVLGSLGREAVRLGGGDGEGEGGGKGGKKEGEAGEGAVKLRKGLGEFLERQGGRGWDLAVVSVNWSGEFITGVVEAGCAVGQGERVRRVVANSIRFPDGRIQGPQELGGEPLVTAGDKLRAMELLRRGLNEERVVYFGDSTTDLACLVEADFAVVMADGAESKLLKTLKRVGFEVSHVHEAGKESKLVWARDFEEVLQSGVMERI
ncbi:hypothetical protein C8A01DRAFT_39518 [Parachaetomium inaequale]|uniref:Uncharacterized protein n=1 Tax=Parachaetomium inaequale TaxID=2588326 RepID=A0AAN6P966_9PEZI|nr:hypothetical protein C8A01DRAFT_39518 [Parachaetomium inaequale]